MPGYGTAWNFPRPPTPDGNWRARAACFKHPRLKPSTWDDTCGREPDDVRTQRIAAAKTVCRTECPVRQQCLDDVDLRHDEGVRGGEDLRDLRTARRRAAYGQAS